MHRQIFMISFEHEKIITIGIGGDFVGEDY